MRYQTRQRFHDFAHILDLIRKIVLGIVFWALVIFLVVAFFAGRPPAIHSGSLLVVNPNGSLVDSYTSPVSYRGVPVGGYANETLLDDLITALDLASDDPKITGAWVNLNNLSGGGSAAVAELSDAVKRFTDSGKNLLASADSFDNARYRIASGATEIVVDRLGEVFPAGYGFWRPYYSEGMEKFGVDANLFRSGEAKTGAENFILDGMSEAARRDEERLLSDLWNTWLEAVAGKRNIEASVLSEWIDNYDTYLIQAGGDGSLAAMEAGLVDHIETGGILEAALAELFGSEDSQHVDALEYVRKQYPRRNRGSIIAVVPVVGALVYGEGAAGMAGSTDVVNAIIAARDTPGVEALVIRIDSPGGDVRAGEAVRRVLEETRDIWGLPVVASMSNLAASGGYWIAVESDLIITREETITGSIGVYSLSLSFEKALSQWLGIRIDGMGTTPWAGAGHPGRTLDDRTASLYEAGVTDIDKMFQTLVAEKRDLSAEAVSSLAGGIPWSGKRALENGLADKSGGLAEARKYAAGLAGLESWRTLYFDKSTDPREQMLGRLLWGQRIRRSATHRTVFSR